MNDDELLRQIIYGDFLTSDEVAYGSDRSRKREKETQSGDPVDDIDRLLAEIRAEYLSDLPDSSPPGKPRPANRPPVQPVNRPPAQPANRPPAQPANRPPAQPANRPPAQPANRPPAQPANRPPAQPAARPPVQPEHIPPERLPNRPPERMADISRENPADADVLSRELLTQMRVLTREVKLLRAELQSGKSIPEISPRTEPKSETTSKRSADMAAKKKGKFWWAGEAAFYLVLIAVVLGAFLIKSNSGGRPTLIAGFSGFTVLTSSMEDTIPKGSLVITKSVDPKTLQVGDDITYMSGATSTITHRIVEIREDYLDTNARAFITKGTMNKNEDKNPVAAANVVGKVVFHSKALGTAAAFLSKNWPIVLFVVVILVGLIYVLKWIFNSEEPKEAQTVTSGNRPQRKNTGYIKGSQRERNNENGKNKS